MIDMYEQQSDSDEDGEVYFLKPVNEYNIVDKIKEANKELFADVTFGQQGNCSTLESESTIKISTTTTTTTKITTMRKVTFAPNLEDYEPESPTNTENVNFQQEDVAADTDDVSFNSTSALTKFPTIEEEEQIAVCDELLEKNIANTNKELQSKAGERTEAKKNPSAYADANVETATEGDDVDEICEEIIVMEMESSTTTKTTATLPKSESFSAQSRRAIVKQTTFDCDEQDNKSLMNLLTVSDGEEDDSRTAQVTDYDEDDEENDGSIFIGIDDFDEEADDDDKLSLIVASYLPDDFERAITITPTSPTPSSSTRKSRSYFRRNTGKALSSCKLPSSFGRRFQLRRKAHSTNSIGTINNSYGGTENSASDASRKNDNLIGLKLNYKTCCEYRNSIRGKLPKYTGYLSEYGLSQEQLQEREQKLQKKQRFVLEQAIKANESEMQKMQDNERAFTTWLRNKMRFPINKTRNMFDVKLRLTGKKKPTPSSCIAEDGDNNKYIGPLGCVAKLRTNS